MDSKTQVVDENNLSLLGLTPLGMANAEFIYISNLFDQASNKSFFGFENLVKYGNPVRYKEDGCTLAHVMAMNGYKFTAAQIMALGNPKDANGDTIGHFMAQKGHCFTADEILEMGDSLDSENSSICELMCYRSRYNFTFDEAKKLIKLVVLKSGGTVAHLMAGLGTEYSVAELLELGNPSDNNGRTVAHVMFHKGHFFSFAEIVALGNPVDNEGNSLAKLSLAEGQFFTDEEKKPLGLLNADSQGKFPKGRLVSLTIDKSKGYFVSYENGQFEKVITGRAIYKLEGFENFDLFSAKTPEKLASEGEWLIAEGKSGAIIHFGDSKNAAIDGAYFTLLALNAGSFQKKIDEATTKWGFSPRYIPIYSINP